jgi:hypothetical protein
MEFGISVILSASGMIYFRDASLLGGVEKDDSYFHLLGLPYQL